METYRMKQVVGILNINADAVHSYIRKALPEEMKPKKTMHEELGRETYGFTKKNIMKLKKAIKLKETGLTYAQVKKNLSLDNVAVAVDEDQVVVDEVEDVEESGEIMGMDLTVINQDGKLLVDSREVARMIEKEHKNLLRDIKGYSDVLGQSSNLSTANFFIESTYTNENNQSYPCYLLTRKGCDMVANKMTGEKGIIFTAKYVTKFEEMEKQQQAPMQQLSPQLQLLISMELKQTEMETAITQTNTRIDSLKDVIALDTRSWRADTKNLIVKMAYKLGGNEHIRDLRSESYDLLDARMGVSVGTRLTNKRRRMAEEGISKSKRDNLNALDVIADDKKLIEGYVAIVKEMAIKYGIAN